MTTTSYRRRCFEEYGRECGVCGGTDNLEVHHRDGDRTNHGLDNLLPLCSDCHNQLHTDGLEGLEHELLPIEQRGHINPDTTNYQFDIPEQMWDDWKATVPRTKSLDKRLIELIEADTEGRVEDGEE